MEKNFKNIDNFLNHICNYDNKTKENLLDFISGTKYQEEKILNIVGNNMTGKTTFLKLMNEVNKLRKFVPFITNEIEYHTMDALLNKSLYRIYIKDLSIILPLYRNLIIINPADYTMKDLFKEREEYLDKIEVLHIDNKFIKTKDEIREILNKDEIKAFAEFLDNEFERRTNLKIEDTKANLKYIKEFDYFMPMNATSKDTNKIYIADILFGQSINQFALRDLLKNRKDVKNEKNRL